MEAIHRMPDPSEELSPSASSPDFSIGYVLSVHSQLPRDKAILLWQIK